MRINRKNDYAFKRIFGHEDTKDIFFASFSQGAFLSRRHLVMGCGNGFWCWWLGGILLSGSQCLIELLY